MGQVFNAKTGRYEDDGQPVVPGVVPIFPPKPEYERTVQERIETPESAAAATKLAVAGGAQLNANEQEAAVTAAESGVQGQAAGETVTALERAKQEQADLETQRRKFADDARAADAAEISEVAKKQIAAGRARADFWKGNAAGEVFAAVLRGIDRAASSFRGESGPTGVDRILEEKFAAHERAVVAEWESSKEAHELKAADRARYEAELARRKIAAANQSELEIKLIGARADKASAALGPERAAAIRAQKDALEMKAQALAEQKRAEGYEALSQTTNRSPTSSGGASRPLSAETRDLMVGAEQYGQLANRNLEIIAQNGGKIPFSGPLAVEFETNDKKMAAILQKPLGKSDADAATARKLQGTPGIKEQVSGRLGITKTVDNYRKSLETNLRTIATEANKAAALEAQPAATAAAGAPAPQQPPPAQAPIEEFTDKKTGQRFKGRRRPDGKIEAVE